MISTNQIPDNTHFARLLCKGLSRNTTNLVAATLFLNPTLLQQNDENYPSMMPLVDTYMLSSTHPRVKNPLQFINLKKTTPANSTSESEDYSLPYGGDSSTDEMNPVVLPEHFQSSSTSFYSNEPQSILPKNSFYYYHPAHY